MNKFARLFFVVAVLGIAGQTFADKPAPDAPSATDASASRCRPSAGCASG